MSSFNAFKSVDDLVAKPVIGSDGAASWQDFQKDTKHHSQHAAPNLPLKRADRMAGITSVEEERTREDAIRKQAGKAGESKGYTVFKRKNEAEEAAARKKRKQIENKIRPDEKKYFISAETFKGWKFDYVFTTRDRRGTGYYWDGSDSVKKLDGDGVFPEEEPKGDKGEGTSTANQEEKMKKKKKKKKKHATAPVIVDDPNNPMEQVADAIRRRNEALSGGPPSALLGLPAGWEAATDSSGKTYYYCRATGERQWDRPTTPASSHQLTGAAPSELPTGWSVAKDESTGKEYYYHTNGETSWERPT